MKNLLTAIALAANEAAGIDEAIAWTLTAVRERMGWSLAHAWRVRTGSGGPELYSSGLWRNAPEAEPFENFVQVTETMRLAHGIGLAGQVLASRRIRTWQDGDGGSEFLRAEVARKAGLRCALAFPVLAHDEVHAVLEFFATTPIVATAEELEALVLAGRQLGFVMARHLAQSERDALFRNYRLLFEGNPRPMVVVERSSHRVLAANDAAFSEYGYPAEAFRALTLPELRATEDERVRARAKLGLDDWTPELHRRRDGTAFWAEISSHDVDWEGRAAALHSIDDVTARLESSSALRALTEKLASSNRELEAFASIASHDLQEPLRKIRAFGDRLLSRFGPALPPDGQDYLQRMQGAAARMQTLIDDLLAFSRLEKEARPFQRVELQRLVKAVLGDLETRVEETKAEVQLEALPAVMGDAAQLRRLFQNLVANALKFRRKDVAPRIEIRCLPPTSAVAERCVIEVVDNGIGFEPKYSDRIFGLFQRLHGRSQYEGTGMGLAICRKVVERHGGQIKATGVPGEGARFQFSLPSAGQEGAWNEAGSGRASPS